ncbi:MAG: hypothetical protein ACLS5A_02840 [Pseudoruminococcus massiliensis]|nr:hypothetical protein [Pseudoruminococcus massiliensis]
MENKVCKCRWKNCKRYGNCKECIEHHQKNNKYPLPYCMRKPNKKDKDK